MLWTIRLMIFVMLPRFGTERTSRHRFALELLAARQQLSIYREKRPRPQLKAGFKAFWILLCRVWTGWKDACVVMKPETVIRWHRAGFRVFWNWKSRTRGGRRTRKDLIVLIRKMATENPTWGAPRIHGELQALGIQVSERTVSRFMPKRIYRDEDLKKRQQNWKTFLKNHREVIAAMDFLVVPTWSFRQLYILVILDHGRRIVRHFNITANPTTEWVKQQLREAFPFDEKPRYLIHDRDQIFRPLKGFLATLGIIPKLTAYHSPWQNGSVERMHGTIRRDLLDHVIPLNEEHLHRLLKEYLLYYHEDRTHLGLNKDSPRGRPEEPDSGDARQVNGEPRSGGLHHRYNWRNAA